VEGEARREELEVLRTDRLAPPSLALPRATLPCVQSQGIEMRTRLQERRRECATR